MFLGLLIGGMALGALASGVWLLSGGSILTAVALYSLVATTFVLGAAVLAFVMMEWKALKTSHLTEALHPAE